MSRKSVFSMLLAGTNLAFLAAKRASSKGKAGYHRTETKPNKVPSISRRGNAAVPDVHHHAGLVAHRFS